MIAGLTLICINNKISARWTLLASSKDRILISSTISLDISRIVNVLTKELGIISKTRISLAS